MAAVPVVKSFDGFEMPLLGFGTWQSTEDELEAALDCALETGYRHIDTAYVYGNEDVIGKVLHKWISSGRIKREDLFITTKLPIQGNRVEHVETCLDYSLKNLQLTYIDLYLIHVPFGVSYTGDNNPSPFKEDGSVDIDMDTDHVAVWKEMEKMVDKGKTRAIGVSNFNSRQVQRLLEIARIRPVNNQIQLYVYLQQPKLVKFLKDNGVIVTSYSTLGSAGTASLYKALGINKELPRVLDNPVVTEIAEAVGRTPAQVLLRHMLQRDIVVLPKSITSARIKSNFELFDFELSESQLEQLNGLNENLPCFNFNDIFVGMEKHPEFYNFIESD